MNTKLYPSVADRGSHFPKRMNQEGRNSGTCSHAAARRVSRAVIVDDADATPRRRINSQLFPALGRAHCGGDAFPFRRQAGKIVGQSGEIAIDRGGAAARCVSRRIFQRRG